MNYIVYKLHLSKADKKSKNMHDLYNENYRTLLKNKKGDPNECRFQKHVPYFLLSPPHPSGF